MRSRSLAFVALLGVLTGAGSTPTADIAEPVSASANIGALAKLALTPSTLAFPDGDPDSAPWIPASAPISITAKARTTPGAQVRLTLQAGDDLRSGLDTIPASALQWTATGAGFVAGTVSKTAAQTVGVWTNSGTRSGTQRFTLANTWTRAPGSYSLTLIYTLSAQ